MTDNARQAGLREAADFVAGKADEFANEFGYGVAGTLCFDRQEKMDHYTTLTELAEEIRALASASGEPCLVCEETGYVAEDTRCPNCNPAPATTCGTCAGSRVVADGEITGCGGVEFSNGPIQCVKDCPTCAAPAPAAQAVTDDQLVALLPGTYYMDPPDGGSVTLLEQLQRMAHDATRWRSAVRFIGARYDGHGYQVFYVSPVLGAAIDLMKGSVAEHFTNAIDAEINKGGRKSAPCPAHGELGALEQGDTL